MARGLSVAADLLHLVLKLRHEDIILAEHVAHGGGQRLVNSSGLEAARL